MIRRGISLWLASPTEKPTITKTVSKGFLFLRLNFVGWFSQNGPVDPTFKTIIGNVTVSFALKNDYFTFGATLDHVKSPHYYLSLVDRDHCGPSVSVLVMY